MATQNLNSIVNVSVIVSATAAPRSNFNEFLIIGISTHISTSTRLKRYTALADMLTDGFISTDPEYEAATLFVGELYNKFGTGASFQLWIGTQGSGESALQAIEACRAASSEWYVGMVCGAAKADHEAIAAWVESTSPATLYVFTTADADVPTNTAGNVFATLQTAGYKRTMGIYSTTTLYAISSLMGYSMGQNAQIGSGVANSAYTLKCKQMTGVTVESLTSSQISIIEGINGNLYLNYGNYYNIYEQGVMADGSFWDEVVNLDILTSRMQLAVMDLLYQNAKIPQTDGGITTILGAINKQCDTAVTTGFIAPGRWNGATVLNLKAGGTLPKGYLSQCEAISNQSEADRQARKTPPIYVAIKEAGAIHFVLITLYVNQ